MIPFASCARNCAVSPLFSEPPSPAGTGLVLPSDESQGWQYLSKRKETSKPIAGQQNTDGDVPVRGGAHHPWPRQCPEQHPRPQALRRSGGSFALAGQADRAVPKATLAHRPCPPQARRLRAGASPPRYNTMLSVFHETDEKEETRPPRETEKTKKADTVALQELCSLPSRLIFLGVGQVRLV